MYALRTLAILVGVLFVRPLTAAERTVKELADIIEDTDKSYTTRDFAIEELKSHGKKAEPALPAIKRLLDDKEERRFIGRLYGTCGAIGEAAVPVVVAGLNKPEPHPSHAAHAFKRMTELGVDLKPIVPDLMAYLRKNDAEKHPNGYKSVLQATIKIHPKFDDIKPALIHLARRNKDLLVAGRGAISHGISIEAIGGLASYGAEAKEAVPTLIYLLQPANNYEKRFLFDPIIALGKIGPDAAEALPELRRIMKLDLHTQVTEQAIEAIKNGQKKPVVKPSGN